MYTQYSFQAQLTQYSLKLFLTSLSRNFNWGDSWNSLRLLLNSSIFNQKISFRLIIGSMLWYSLNLKNL